MWKAHRLEDGYVLHRKIGVRDGAGAYRGTMRRWAVVVALAASLIAGAQTGGEATSFHDLAGAPHSLGELRGHLAVVNFWATWCGPCRDEMPRLQKLSAEYAARDVRFVAVSLDAPETQGKIDAAIRKSGLRFPVWTGATDRTLSDLKLGVLVPATLILDADGQVIGKIEGEAREKDVRSRLDWLLGGRQGKQPKVEQKNDW